MNPTSLFLLMPACLATGLFTWFGTGNGYLGAAAGMAVFAIVTAIYSACIDLLKALNKN